MFEKNKNRMIILALVVFQSLTVLWTAFIAMGSNAMGHIEIALAIIAVIGVGTSSAYYVLQKVLSLKEERDSQWMENINDIATDSQNVLLANEVVSMMTEQTQEQMEEMSPLVCKIATLIQSQIGKSESCLSHLMQVDQILHVTSEAIVSLSEKTEQIRTEDVQLMNDIRGIRGQLMLAKEALLAHEHLLTEKVSELAEDSMELAKATEKTMASIESQQQCVSAMKDSFKKIEMMGARLSVALQDRQVV